VDGDSLVVVVTELDEGASMVVDDAVRVVAELKASYFVVGEVKTCAIGSDLNSEGRSGQSPGSVMSATPISIVMTHVLVVDLIVSYMSSVDTDEGTYLRKWSRQRHHVKQRSLL
jgi:hypothetical protein